MTRRHPPVRGIERMDALQARQAIAPLHAYLRDRILDGTLRPGSRLSQVTLADQLGVSRTPLREVMRMLQEEGLVEIEPNQRARVSLMDREELDEIYASRVLVETLSLSLTLPVFDVADGREGKRLLAAMKRASVSNDAASWFRDHTAFHRLITQGAGVSLQRQQRLLADRSIRYIRIYQLGESQNWQVAGHVEHSRILRAMRSRDQSEAVPELALHLSRTAMRVLGHLDPGFVPVAVPHAVQLVTTASTAGTAP